MKIPRTTLDEIQRKTDVLDIIGSYVHLERRGSRWWGLCPFHDEKTPSFTVDQKKGLFHCFGCGKGGNVFQFIMDIEGLSFPEAAGLLASKAGVQIEEQSGDSKEQDEHEALKEVMRRISGSFQYILKNADEAETGRKYLADRGLSKDTVDRFKLGYAPAARTWLFNFLKGKRYSEEFLMETGLFSRKYPEITIFSGRIIFPIMNHRGETLAFGGRTMGDGPKYINSPETKIYRKSENLYGLFQALADIRKKREVYVAEGYMDVLSLSQAGVTNTVAPLGTALTERQLHLLKRYANRIILVFDNDNAGVEAAKKAAVLCEKLQIEHRVAAPVDGEDPSDILQKHGAVRLKEEMEETVPTLDFLMTHLEGDTEIKSPEGKQKLAGKLFDYVEAIQSQVKRAAVLEVLADHFHVNIEAMYLDYRSRMNRLSKEESKDAGNRRKTEERIPEDLFLCLALTANHQYFKKTRNLITIDDLHDERARLVFAALEDAFRQDELGLDTVLDRIEDQNLSTLIRTKILSGEFGGESAARMISDTVRSIRLRRLRKQEEDLSWKIRAAEKQNARKTVQELLSEKMYIIEERKKLEESTTSEVS
ncbi:MAG: DNA primase [Spirochaetales bacterium]|nr:DNA primase [Spirochaetales bacterium]